MVKFIMPTKQRNFAPMAYEKKEQAKFVASNFNPVPLFESDRKTGLRKQDKPVDAGLMRANVINVTP